MTSRRIHECYFRPLDDDFVDSQFCNANIAHPKIELILQLDMAEKKLSEIFEG